jgi:trans-2,3-dihydro-3-hydroxyanthranilate isomerase
VRRRFFTLDVFTHRRFAGNPLAVVLEPAGLDTAAMQRIANEFNLSETVFVQPPESPDHRARLRIFTPASELPFAGHPTVGTAVLLALVDSGGAPGERRLVLGEAVGPVACSTTIAGPGEGEATFTLPRLPQRIADAPSDAALAAALDLKAHEIGMTSQRPAIYSAGVPFALVPLVSRDAVSRARPMMQAWEAGFGGAAAGHCFVYCAEPIGPHHDYHARMFAPTLGVAEDPATGSAVAALAGQLAATDHRTDGEHRLVVEQGYAMGRPSDIVLTLTVAGGKLAKATVGGGAVVVSEGTIEA